MWILTILSLIVSLLFLYDSVKHIVIIIKGDYKIEDKIITIFGFSLLTLAFTVSVVMCTYKLWSLLWQE
jgi:hypothetical protein